MAKDYVVTEDTVQTVTNKTIDADNNTVSNLEVDNLKTSAVSTTIAGASSAVDTKLPTEKAVRTQLDLKATVYFSDTEPAEAVEGDYWATEDGASIGNIYAADMQMTSSDPKKVDVAINECERSSNKVTAVTSASTDVQYPTAKAVATLMQTFYNAIYPVGGRQICFNEPVVPAGVTATWEVDTTFDGKAMWIDSTKSFGTALAGSLPNIVGEIRFGGINNYKWQTGPFTYGYEQAWGDKSGGSDTLYLETAMFQASRANGIYGAAAGANVVRPTSVTVKVYIRTA